MRTYKLGLTLVALFFGLAMARPAFADAAPKSCKAQCEADTHECKKMCKEHAPPKVQGRCTSTCKKVEQQCKAECDKGGSQ